MFLWSALAHFIALTSPGPDTAIVLRQVSLHGRIEGFKASLGIGIGIYIHCILAVNGISIIIVSNELYKFLNKDKVNKKLSTELKKEYRSNVTKFMRTMLGLKKKVK